MSDTESIIREYWNDLPREMRVELIQDGANTKTILRRVAAELGVDVELESKQGHVTKAGIVQFAVAVMEKYGSNNGGLDE